MHSDDDVLPPLPCSKSSTDCNSEVTDQGLESSCQPTSSISAIPANAMAVLFSLEAMVKELSIRLNVVDKQITSMARDIRKLKVVNGIDVDDLLESQSIQLMTRDDVS